MKKARLKAVSNKRRGEIKIYQILKLELFLLGNNKSELSGLYGLVDPHHIDGRRGKRLFDPYNIILLTKEEHDRQTDYLPGYKTRKELVDIVKPIRKRQGF